MAGVTEGGGANCDSGAGAAAGVEAAVADSASERRDGDAASLAAGSLGDVRSSGADLGLVYGEGVVPMHAADSAVQTTTTPMRNLVPRMLDSLRFLERTPRPSRSLHSGRAL